MITGERTVLVDMDGVLADFEGPNNGIIRAHFPDHEVTLERSEFYFKDTYKDYPKIVDKVETASRAPGFFRSFPVIDGAIDGWRRILEAGYVPQVCSSPLENHETVIQEKKEWLEEHFAPVFGAWVVDTAIFDRDKSGYDAIAMIDDRPTLRNIGRAAWQHIIFSRSYNKDIATEFRIKDWHDLSLEGLLDVSRHRYVLRKNH